MTKPANPLGRRASDIEQKEMDWVIERFLAISKLHDLTGNPGLGKSFLMAELAARLTTGGLFAGIEVSRIGPVAILSAEDDEDDTIVPRLAAAGANRELITVIPPAFADRRGIQHPLTFPDHLPILEELFKALGIIAFIIDPISAFLSSRTDTNNDSSVRRVLAELAAMARRLRIAILYVRHLNKQANNDSALYRGGGSIAFVAAARVASLLGLDPTDPAPLVDRRRVFACVKSNLAPFFQSRAFRIIHDDSVPHIEWLADPSLLSADDLLRAPGRRKEALEEAITFLTDSLADGPVPVAMIEDRARQLRIAEPTLNRARKVVGAVSRREGFQGPMIMSLDADRRVEEVKL